MNSTAVTANQILETAYDLASEPGRTIIENASFYLDAVNAGMVDEYRAEHVSVKFSPISTEPAHCANCDCHHDNHGPNGECAHAEARYLVAHSA